ncbi:hypothetical protein ElyMa_003899400 [Elysia marginata]|uniref:Uncharacterized protein n=1 Tax=Elysia marginata TaxID=1093978 RepID=A0AAV4FN08_9GAST|nr:hypothetical protein ElyMa_003899400 [Elysia marginata]
MRMQGCAIHYCAESGSLRATELPNVRKPPFSLEPPETDQGPQLLFDQASKSWVPKSDVQLARGPDQTEPNQQQPSQQSLSNVQSLQKPDKQSLSQVKFLKKPSQQDLPKVQSQQKPDLVSGQSGPIQKASGPIQDRPQRHGYIKMRPEEFAGLIVGLVSLVALTIAVSAYIVHMKTNKENIPHTEVTPLRPNGSLNPSFQQIESSVSPSQVCSQSMEYSVPTTDF